MKQIADRLIIGSQIAVVALALLALVVSGAGAAARLFDTPVDSAESPERPLNATLDQKSDPEETPGEMATNGRPWTEQAAYLQATSALLGGASQSRFWTDSDPVVMLAHSGSAAGRSDPVSASATLVDHRLGHRFTLLGLKPSGTS